MSDSKSNTLQTALLILLSALGAVLLPVAGFALLGVVELKEFRAEIRENLGGEDIGALVQMIHQISEDNALDIEQNRRLDELRVTDRKFWQLHSAARDYINSQHRELDDPQFVWPILVTE